MRSCDFTKRVQIRARLYALRLFETVRHYGILATLQHFILMVERSSITGGE